MALAGSWSDVGGAHIQAFTFLLTKTLSRSRSVVWCVHVACVVCGLCVYMWCCVWCWWCVGCACTCGVVCGVGGTNDSQHGESVLARADDATNSGGRTPGSKLPASPPPLPRPDGGGTPGRVPVYTAKKANPSTDEQHLWSCTTGRSTTCVAAPLRPKQNCRNIRSETSTTTRHREANPYRAISRRRAQGNDSCSGNDGPTIQRDCEQHQKPCLRTAP